MANVQLQKPQTITTTAIVQQQSQEVVQTIVHGGLSSLSYLREFFPDKAFVHRVYGEGDDIPRYEDYAAGRLPKERSAFTSSSPGMNMQLLLRGKSRRVDMMLDWLESGAFPAMRSGNLRALQIFVHADPQDRTRVIESYTFTVKYMRNADNQQIPAGIEVGRIDAEPVTVGATSRELQQLVKQINLLCDNLPQLPSKRYVSMALIYNEDNSIPTGWMQAPPAKLMMGEAAGWMRRQETFDKVSSLFHDTKFEISYLQRASNSVIAPFIPSIIPEELSYIQERPMLTEPSADAHDANDHGTDQVKTAALNEVFNTFAETQFPEQPADSRVALLTGSVPTQSLAPKVNDGIAFEHPSHFRMPSHHFSASADAPDQNDTQLSNVDEMKEAFLKMMRPEEVTQGDTQTQPPLQASRSAASETTASPGRDDPSPLARKKSAAPKSDNRLVLSQTAAARIEREKPKKTRATTKSKGSKAKSKHVITCQCGYAEEEGDMVCCNICDTWQHLRCYGFTSKDDPRLPKEHVCYQCLLGNAEPQTLINLRDLMQRRQVMNFILYAGPKKASDIAVSLQLAVSDTESIVGHLHQEAYIAPAKGVKRSASGKTAYAAVKSGPKHAKMRRDLFDPLLLISHYYETPNLGDEPLLSKRFTDTSTLQMPPPTTPACRLRRKLAQTPCSGLDLADATTDGTTPSRPRTRQTSGVKRPLAEDAAENNRVKRVQTQFILDADGMSSSPAGSTHG